MATLSIVLRQQKPSETPKDRPHEIFLGDQMFSINFCDTALYGSQKLLHLVNGQHQKISETPETSRNTKMAPY